MWKYELKAIEIFKTGFCVMQCFNCLKYGHIAKIFLVTAKCGHCAGEHKNRICPVKEAKLQWIPQILDKAGVISCGFSCDLANSEHNLINNIS